MIKVSVIVPVYKVEDYLEKCLKSLAEQTLKEIEIIVVNDGSPDNSQKIIDKYEKKYPKKIKGYQKENGGLSDARNYGLKYAKGEYIGFVDSDDYVEKDMFEKMYKKAKEKDYDIVVCDLKKVFDNGKAVINHMNFHYSEDNIRNYIIAPPMACNKIYKKNIFDNNEFQKGIFYEDLNLIPTLAINYKNICFLEEPLYYYVQRNGSIMKQNMFNNKLLDIFLVLENIEKKYKQEGTYIKYKSELEYLNITHLLRTAGLRFSMYPEGKEYINKISKMFRDKYNNWRQNEYYKQSSIKLKIICNLTYNKMTMLLKILGKINR